MKFYIFIYKLLLQTAKLRYLSNGMRSTTKLEFHQNFEESKSWQVALKLCCCFFVLYQQTKQLNLRLRDDNLK